jgi:hypothetical protein
MVAWELLYFGAMLIWRIANLFGVLQHVAPRLKKSKFFTHILLSYRGGTCLEPPSIVLSMFGSAAMENLNKSALLSKVLSNLT